MPIFKTYIDFPVVFNVLMFSLSAKHDVHVKKETPAPVKNCSFDEQIKGCIALVDLCTTGTVKKTSLITLKSQ